MDTKEELSRLLDVVRKALGGVDARLEIGGRPPSDGHIVWSELNRDTRLVVIFDTPPDERADCEERLAALLAPFKDVADSVRPRIEKFDAIRERELDGFLAELAETCKAESAWVIDEGSPVIWGTSAPRVLGWDINGMEDAQRLCREVDAFNVDVAEWLSGKCPASPGQVGVDATQWSRWDHRFARLSEMAPGWDKGRWASMLHGARALLEARRACRQGRAPDRVVRHQTEFGFLARGLASTYLVVLVFNGPFAELTAEGPLVRQLPTLEQLVLALPPVDPPPGRAKVIRLRP